MILSTTMETCHGGRRLRVARLGKGPTLVLLHGYPDNLQIWCALAARLAARYEVIAFDWPGMGYSDPWPGAATPMHMAERLHKLLDQWGLDTVHLAGLDMGGQPALAFAARYPQRLDKLIIINSLVFGDEKTSWEIRLLRRFGWNRHILSRLPRLVFRRAERTFLPPGLRLPEELREDFWRAFRSAAVRRFIIKMCAGYQGALAGLPELYRKILAPCLILWAERDGHFPPLHAKRLKQAINDATLVILPEARHWMVWNRAEEVAKEIEAFLE